MAQRTRSSLPTPESTAQLCVIASMRHSGLDAVKISSLVLRNDSPRRRRLSVTGYVEWVLGDLREKNAPHIHTEIAVGNGALYARNRYSNDFGDWIAFFDVDPADRVAGSVTADRDEFIGRNGSLRRPAALRRAGLSGRTGAALDPCGAIQAVIELAPGQSREIVFGLGMGRSADEAAELVQRHRGVGGRTHRREHRSSGYRRAQRHAADVPALIRAVD
jgi:cellobiose phosphorylase